MYGSRSEDPLIAAAAAAGGAQAGDGNDGVVVHASNRFAGAFEKHVKIPIAVDRESLKATYADGVLEARIRKATAAQPAVRLSFGASSGAGGGGGGSA